ncbi:MULTISPECIES: DsbA family protein [Exiguobacterium]|uniref:DsbA family protein n=1 Tax=Exiguobacterium TaxID=33986 RepID=UPI001BEACBEB|nr:MULTISPECIES: thioredoxin domain-containing protein [Exiguobacterium]MCT4781672.1 thioredoxin domain-containing protein [Exiguobacterium himgiriensis]
MRGVKLMCLATLLFLAACNPTGAEKEEETYTYEAYELPLAEKVALGDGKDEIVFIFDYSCPWCKKWMESVLPEIESRWIDTGKVSFKGQPLVLLNERSQLLASVDLNVERHMPTRYYEVQRQIGMDSGMDDFGTEAYVRRLAKTLEIDPNLLLVAHTDTGIQNARLYTRDLGVAYVPTVYVNGVKLLDAFSLEEMERVLNGEIKAGDVVDVPAE